MNSFREFITFDLFVAEHVLIVFYFLSSVLMPIVAWYALLWIIRRYAVTLKILESSKFSLVTTIVVWLLHKFKFFKQATEEKVQWESFNANQKTKFILLFLFLVVLSEVFLRLMFEYLIAFMQIHEFLNLK